MSMVRMGPPARGILYADIEWSTTAMISAAVWKVVHRWRSHKPLAWKCRTVNALLRSKSAYWLRAGLVVVNLDPRLIHLDGEVCPEGMALKDKILGLASESDEAAKIQSHALHHSIGSRFLWAVLAQANHDGFDSVRFDLVNEENRLIVYFVDEKGSLTKAVVASQKAGEAIFWVVSNLEQIGFEGLRPWIKRPSHHLPESITILHLDSEVIHIRIGGGVPAQ